MIVLRDDIPRPYLLEIDDFKRYLQEPGGVRSQIRELPTLDWTSLPQIWEGYRIYEIYPDKAQAEAELQELMSVGEIQDS